MGCGNSKDVIAIRGRNYLVRSATFAETDYVPIVIDLVEDEETQKIYVLKRILCQSKAERSEALKEVKFQNQLIHPNIQKCLGSTFIENPDKGIADRSELLVLLPFYHQKGNLQDKLNERNGICKRHFTENDILNFLLKICAAVEVMHDAQCEALAHRDLNPKNILLTKNGEPLIINFRSMGKARHEILGSVQARNLQDFIHEHSSMAYRAPELFNIESNCTIDERTDIWSLGCILYAMCFFESPFEVNGSADAIDLPDAIPTSLPDFNVACLQGCQTNDDIIDTAICSSIILLYFCICPLYNLCVEKMTEKALFYKI